MRIGILLPASLLAAALAIPCASLARANIVVTIDKTTQQMSVAIDGVPRYVWPVSTGRRGYDTPNGTFKVNRMDADHLSQEWDNAPMPHTMFFDMRGHAIHGFPTSSISACRCRMAACGWSRTMRQRCSTWSRPKA